MRKSVKFLGVTLVRKRSSEVIQCKKILFSTGPWSPCRLILLDDGKVGVLAGSLADKIFKWSIDAMDMTDIAEGLVKLGSISRKTADKYKSQREAQRLRSRRRAARSEVTSLAKRAGITFTRDQRKKLEAVM